MKILIKSNCTGKNIENHNILTENLFSHGKFPIGNASVISS